MSGLQSDCVFTAADKGDFTLAHGSPGLAASADMPVAFADGTAGVVRGGGAIGAMQGAKPYAGLNFVDFVQHYEAGEFSPP